MTSATTSSSRAPCCLVVLLVLTMWSYTASATVQTSTTTSLCPAECRCVGTTVDCSSRGLTAVPRDIPRNCNELLLQRNNITQLTSRDFARLNKLIKLNLEHNQISVIHYRTFDHLPLLTSLNLGHNRISCIQDRSFRNQRKLEVLTISNNNLTTLALQAFKTRMPQLRRLRLHSNRLNCDCHLMWLKTWLSRPQNRGLATLATCHQPIQVRGHFVTGVPRNQFTCNEFMRSKRLMCHTFACPARCNCDETGFVDCRERELQGLPQTLPQDTHQLRFSYNQIDVIPSYAFADFNQLKLVNLNYNGIKQIDPDAFEGLTQLRALHMHHNQITSIHEHTFQSLRNLEVLFLQSNEIRCLSRNTFHGLRALTTLSLYGNKLQSLPYGIFDPLHDTLFNLYLANNPLQCDCRLRWLTKYLRHNQAVEKSDVRCHGPKAVSKREVYKVKRRQYRNCPALNRDDATDVCLIQTQCPNNCRCEGSTVTCTRLTTIPTDLPLSVSELILRLNNIQVISNNGIFEKYASLKKIDLSNNQISTIEDGAFRGATSLTELRLNENKLTDVRASMFEGLDNLQILQIRNNRLNCIGNHSFIGLRNLRHLDLFSNQISTIDQGSFQSLTNVQTLNILSNELNCDCRLIWLRNWFQQNSRISSGKPRCYLPFIQRNIPLTDINPTDFPCPPMTSPLMTCTPKRKCPSMCVCEGSVVRCSNVHLQQIPVNEIPDDVTELYLDRNEIRGIPLEINRFVRLQRLDLSDNQITRLNGNIFKNLTQLERLILGYNRIQCIELRTFSDLHSLETLSLQSNLLSSIPEGSFSDLTSLRRLDLGENPWNCDCNLRWMVTWMEDQIVDPGIARCSGPIVMGDRLITSNSPEQFQCNGPLDIEVAAKCNPCLSSPCQYDATCRRDDVMIYQCECPPGFKGRNCETPIDPCILNPCQNEGRCHARNERVFECSCKLGFSGDLCETNIDDCLMTSQCSGVNKRCVDGINNFTCECIDGWTGENCDEKLLDICATQQPCANGGHCLNQRADQSGQSSYKCVCEGRYRGVNCSDSYEECHLNKCEHGSTCMSDPSNQHGYRCLCASDFTGQFCNIFQDTRINILQDDPCNKNDCENNSTCQATSANASGYKCLCSPGFTGTHCSSLLSLSFVRNGSYVILPPLGKEIAATTEEEIQFTFQLSTLQENGILFYWGPDPVLDHRRLVTVEFFSGHVKLKMGMSRSDWTTVYSPNPINDGRLHKVNIRVSAAQLSVSVDDGRLISRHASVTAPQPPQPQQSDADEVASDVTSVIQIGGVSDDVIMDSNRYWFFSNSTSFKGCIHSLRVNGDVHDFRSVSQLRGRTDHIAPGCMMTSSSAGCNLRCRHGHCVAIPNPHCQCEPGYGGKLCGISLARLETNCPCVHGRCVLPANDDVTMVGRARSSAAGGRKRMVQCKCDEGYTGVRCERDVESSVRVRSGCTTTSCGTRGRCVETKNGGHRCQCHRSYGGVRCQTRVRRCKGLKTRKFMTTTRPSPVATRSSAASNANMTCTSTRAVSNVQCIGPCQRQPAGRGPPPLTAAGAIQPTSSTTPAQSCCQPQRIRIKRIKYRCTDGSDVTGVVKKVKRCVCKC